MVEGSPAQAAGVLAEDIVELIGGHCPSCPRILLEATSSRVNLGGHTMIAKVLMMASVTVAQTMMAIVLRHVPSIE